ncbi:MAG TPA: non-canonical purine NTP pyrophosphatase, partial [Kiritimatiellia bacterium]|nr:non-canonical purine NTP pyrophosphatase [Kiritimatiellia bacterium]
MTLLIATRNHHKLDEIRQIFALPSLRLIAADELPGLPDDIVEDADTFEGNALKKARELCAASGLWTLADDSGLEVAALDNAPGVFSARYAGEPCDYAANNAKLLRAL